jgi:GR25 family glycosyltransferase involved in LPS biosynthesis
MLYKLISLKRTPDRLHKFVSNNNHIMKYVEIFEAIDGGEIYNKTDLTRNFFTKNLTYTQGAIGCALSHINIWIECVEKNKFITVFEDDSIIHNDFISLNNKIIFELNNNWDICLNGWNLDSFLIFKMMEQMRYSMMLLDQESYRNNISNFQSSILNISCFKLIRAFGTACYSISPLGAKKLLSSLLVHQ